MSLKPLWVLRGAMTVVEGEDVIVTNVRWHTEEMAPLLYFKGQSFWPLLVGRDF